MTAPTTTVMTRNEFEALLKKERADARALRKSSIAKAQLIKNTMTVSQRIQFVNTPYSQLPDELKPGMIQHPQTFNFIHMQKPNLGRQQETFAARLIRFRDKYHLTPEQFVNYCNDLAMRYDLPSDGTRRAQKTRITLRDIHNYENFNVCPKIDKMTIMAEAMGVDIDYLAGYGTQNRRCRNQAIESRYRKERKVS